MDPIPEKIDLAWILKNKDRIRDALRTVGQSKNLDYILPGGEVRRAQYAQKARNAVLDLRSITSVVSALQTGRPPPGSMEATGGTESQDGEYHIHIFLTDGTFTVTNGGIAELLVIGGGGGGGVGGGGAGRYLKLAAQAMSPGTYPVTIGAGGAPGIGTPWSGDPGLGTNGGDTSIGVFKAIGGGGGGSMGGGTQQNGRDGGSGGGSGQNAGGGGEGGVATNGSGTSGGVGFKGGGRPYPEGFTWFAGGGGAGGLGGDAITSFGIGGLGGLGLSDDITGTLQFYAGGGGGAGQPGGTGGSGVGGTGNDADAPASVATPGVANTGSGGGGGYGTGSAAYGGSGIVVVRYLGGGAPSIPGQIGNETFPQPGTPGVTPGTPTACEACIAQIVVADGEVVTSDDQVVTSEG